MRTSILLPGASVAAISRLVVLKRVRSRSKFCGFSECTNLADYEHIQVFLDHDQAAKCNLYQWASFSKGLSLQRYFAYIIIIALIFANEKSKKGNYSGLLGEGWTKLVN